MSFTLQCKDEICKKEEEKICCKKAECYGMLLFTKLFSQLKNTYHTENGILAKRLAENTASVAGIVVETKTEIRRDTKSYRVLIDGAEQRQRLLETFGHREKEINLRIHFSNLESPCCCLAFLRGVFLSCGAVSDPYKEYHLEFVSPYYNLSQDLLSVIAQIGGIKATVSNRKGNYVVYIKESEMIADLLAGIGASQCSMELMQAKMLKEVRNYVNRKTNFETANIDKTVSAAIRQIEAIKKLTKAGIFSDLPEDLQVLANLRLENPQWSLQELSKELGMSRSGVNHRLKRLMEMAENLVLE